MQAVFPPTSITRINWASSYQSHKHGTLCARIWKRAAQTDRTNEASTIDYGWNATENCLKPDWGTREYDTVTEDGDSVGATSTDDESDNAWRTFIAFSRTIKVTIMLFSV